MPAAKRFTLPLAYPKKCSRERVVEGACGHLVQDRMEQAGMRGTVEGAQAVLDLRAVRLNDDWEAYWAYHRQQQHQRLYGTAAPLPHAVEAQVLQLAA